MWTPFRRPEAAPRLHWDQRPALVYAIGDVHGCLDELQRLESRILADAAADPGQKLIVMLGDYIDRGPKSAQTLDWLLQPAPPGFQRICLRGNHEAWFLDALAHPEKCDDWLTWGGRETLASYNIEPDRFVQASGKARRQLLQSTVPEEHCRLLRTLPVLLDMPDYVFVHAGLRPGIPLDQQSDADLMWIREPFLSQPHGGPKIVVHGHTPDTEPSIRPYRIGIDTLAYGGGVLTALRIPLAGEPSMLTS